jgi:hypothetical protein
MIWFACKKCGKAHKRPEEAIGTLVFCTCGEGNRVPWENTITPPEEPPEPEAPRVDPAPAVEEEEDRPRRRPRRREEPRRDPAYCFNHEDQPSEQTCADCGEAFCSACVVTLQDRVLCGPCKNFRIRGLQRPKQVPALAVLALVAGLASGPLSFCLTVPIFNPQTGGQPALALGLSVGGLLLPLGALVLGAFALREIETKPHTGGRGTAVTGMTTAVAGLLWCLAVTLVLSLRTWVG